MSTEHILVVEDEPAIADALKYALDTEGFQVTWCATAAEAYSQMKNTPVDFVILDVGLPDDSGFDVCRKIRSQSQVPILFLTARDSEIDRIVGLELGADDYVVKPFSPREVTARVRAILRRTRSASSGAPTLEGSPLRIDAKKQRFQFFGQPLELSRYEFRLIEALAARPGQVFTREQLMDLVWDEPDSSFDRTVDTHVKTLRSKMRKIRPDVDVIVTHRGTGYSLREQLDAKL
ncbi:MAG: two-component system catabolic regulation response regulator CreB [Candidatus Promineifilaceae bacterium]|jgi:two-component system catabolic regulation response regulator CreB